jgi:hypothetical protein
MSAEQSGTMLDALTINWKQTRKLNFSTS